MPKMQNQTVVLKSTAVWPRDLYPAEYI